MENPSPVFPERDSCYKMYAAELQGVGDGLEGAADDDAHSHVHHIALEGESFEIFNKRHKIIGVIGPVCQRAALGVGTGEVGLVNCRYRGHVAATGGPAGQSAPERSEEA